jgi:drug/metabolite transporter (DMT)-like permease
MGAMLASNWSLKYVNYPTQVLGKSCKPIPVMLLAVLFRKKRYPISKYIIVFLIVCGVALFLYKDVRILTLLTKNLLIRVQTDRHRQQRHTHTHRQADNQTV